MANPSAPADDAAVQTAQTEPTATTVTFAVSGMKCSACSAKITKALQEVEGVTAADADAQAGTAQVVLAPDSTITDALVAVITELGYKATVATD
jgi:Cu+-exporting ATPase